jgi:histidinol-phosphatase (PHP family)
MKLINHHVHSTGSDGKLSPREVVSLAVDLDFNFICFTDHYPRLMDEYNWSTNFFSEDYVREVKNVIEEFSDKIEIGFGVEMEWVEGYEDKIKEEIGKYDFDCVLGTIHFLIRDGKPFLVNYLEENFEKAVDLFGGIRNFVREYYHQIRLMVKSGLFDCVAHLDIIKCFNKDSKYFDENEKWYQKEILKTLDVIADVGIAIEVSSAGFFYPTKSIFPSSWILEEAKKRCIAVTVSSDFHGMDFPLDYKLEEMIGLLKEIGYDYIVKFKNRRGVKILIM